jgi:hypothetical protein
MCKDSAGCTNIKKYWAHVAVEYDTITEILRHAYLYWGSYVVLTHFVQKMLKSTRL